ncbi:conserved hypothetical protein [Ricinus communis]|uniref:Uncharacterized protein n=1 Tax=Ricinus communis TaxID=3988 RepID=B9T2K2_RICCO|nr:conserved hypothetical protein [Ricinus communis]
MGAMAISHLMRLGNSMHSQRERERKKKEGKKEYRNYAVQQNKDRVWDIIYY